MCRFGLALGRQHFQAVVESVGLECLFPTPVIEWVIGVEPVAAGIDVEVGHLRRFRVLNEQLLLRNQTRNEIDLVLVEVELAAVKLQVHVGVRQEDFGWTAFEQDVEDIRLSKLIKRLRGKHERRVVLSPSLQGLDNIGGNARVLQKNPSFVNEERLEYMADLGIANNRVGAMQNVEEQRFQ